MADPTVNPDPARGRSGAPRDAHDMLT